MKRRLMLGAATLALLPRLGRAAPRRLAFLAQIARPQPLEGHIFGSFAARLREIGWGEGPNFAIDWQFGNGNVGAMPELAAAIVRSGPDVVVTAGTIAAIAMRKATTTLPIVFGNVSDPVGAGLVQSLNRPGTNCTGASILSATMMPKLVELMIEALPAAREFALLVNPLQPSHATILAELAPVARARGVRVRQYGSATPGEIEAALAAMGRDGVRAVFVPNEGLFIQHRKLLARAALAQRVALGAIDLQFAEDGALLAYGPDQHDIFRTVADYADRILRGARPQDLPVQQPTLLRLVVNTETERELKLQLPHAVRLRVERLVP